MVSFELSTSIFKTYILLLAYETIWKEKQKTLLGEKKIAHFGCCLVPRLLAHDIDDDVSCNDDVSCKS